MKKQEPRIAGKCQRAGCGRVSRQRINQRPRLKMFICAGCFGSLYVYEIQRLFEEFGVPNRRVDSSKPKD
jgi:hypothetical protein